MTVYNVGYDTREFVAVSRRFVDDQFTRFGYGYDPVSNSLTTSSSGYSNMDAIICNAGSSSQYIFQFSRRDELTAQGLLPRFDSVTFTMKVTNPTTRKATVNFYAYKKIDWIDAYATPPNNVLDPANPILALFSTDTSGVPTGVNSTYASVTSLGSGYYSVTVTIPKGVRFGSMQTVGSADVLGTDGYSQEESLLWYSQPSYIEVILDSQDGLGFLGTGAVEIELGNVTLNQYGDSAPEAGGSGRLRGQLFTGAIEGGDISRGDLTLWLPSNATTLSVTPSSISVQPTDTFLVLDAPYSTVEDSARCITQVDFDYVIPSDWQLEFDYYRNTVSTVGQIPFYIVTETGGGAIRRIGERPAGSTGAFGETATVTSNGDGSYHMTVNIPEPWAASYFGGQLNIGMFGGVLDTAKTYAISNFVTKGPKGALDGVTGGLPGPTSMLVEANATNAQNGSRTSPTATAEASVASNAASSMVPYYPAITEPLTPGDNTVQTVTAQAIGTESVVSTESSLAGGPVPATTSEAVSPSETYLGSNTTYAATSESLYAVTAQAAIYSADVAGDEGAAASNALNLKVSFAANSSDAGISSHADTVQSNYVVALVGSATADYQTTEERIGEDRYNRDVIYVLFSCPQLFAKILT